jgi:hypothetical protein
MSRPRAADDFPAIRARMHELRRENTTRARAADDFCDDPSTNRRTVPGAHRDLFGTTRQIAERRPPRLAGANSLRGRASS